jgi:hypothetical protein
VGQEVNIGFISPDGGVKLGTNEARSGLKSGRISLEFEELDDNATI